MYAEMHDYYSSFNIKKVELSHPLFFCSGNI